MPAKFAEVLEALEFANTNGFGEYQAYVCKQSGKIYLHTDYDPLDSDELDNELPADIDDEDKYLALPDKRELGLGKPLALDFAGQNLAGDLDEVRRMFHKRGAYASFRRLLERRRVLDLWYDFERKATERALREWCEVNSIEIEEPRRRPRVG